MSTVRERARTRRPAASVRRGRGTGARWRVAGRLARRQVARTKLSSLLVAILVALPIAGMSGFAVWADSSAGTPAERVRVELGAMQAWVQGGGIPDAGFWQVPDEPTWTGYPTDASGAWSQPDGEPATDPTTALPAGTRTIETLENAILRVRTAAGSTAVAAWLGETWDPAFAGRFDLVEGDRPTTDSEALVTPATLERAGLSIGDELVLTDGGEAFTVVGTLDAAGLADSEPGVFLPLTDDTDILVTGNRRWYLPERALEWADVQELNEAGVVALSREVMLDPPTDLTEDQLRAQGSRAGLFWSMVAVIAVGGAFAAYVVVMLAGAAFAVAARRQQRALAIVASVGAGRRDLFRTVVLQGTALGAVGGAVGVGLGVGGGAAVLALTDDGSGTQPWGFHVPWWGLGIIFVFAVVVGTLSALVPARSVARSDAIGALRGARRPQRPTAARPIWGSLLILGGAGITLACGLALAAVSAAGSEIAYDSPVRWLPIWGIVIGPILAQIGILLSGRWLLWTTSRMLSRASTAARIASRDAAANAARTVPAFAAIGATVFLGVFVAAASSMGTANSARNWQYQAPVGSLTVTAYPGAQSVGPIEPLTTEQWDEALTAIRELAVDAGASEIATIGRQVPAWEYLDRASIPEDATQAVALLPEEHLISPDQPYYGVGDPQNNIAIIPPGELATALGVELSDTDLAAYRAGAAIVTDGRFITDGTIDVAAWPLTAFFDGTVPTNHWLAQEDGPELTDPVWEERVDAVRVNAPHQPSVVALAPEVAQERGLTLRADKVIGSFAEPMTVQQRDRLYALAGAAGTLAYSISASVETGPPSAAAWLVPLLAVVSVLVVGASSVALGLARFERRPDDATLAAVGGTRSLRRRIGFWQGLLIAGFGTAAGAVAGILPAIGLSLQGGDTMRLADVPWLVLAALAILLPLGIAAVNMLVPPRAPDLTRRAVIA